MRKLIPIAEAQVLIYFSVHVRATLWRAALVPTEFVALVRSLARPTYDTLHLVRYDL